MTQKWFILFIYNDSFFFNLKNNLCGAVLGLHCYVGVSLVATSGGYSVVAVCGLLITVASLVVEREL